MLVALPAASEAAWSGVSEAADVVAGCDPLRRAAQYFFIRSADSFALGGGHGAAAPLPLDGVDRLAARFLFIDVRPCGAARGSPEARERHVESLRLPGLFR